MIDREALHRLLKLLKTCGPTFFGLADEERQKLILDIASAGAEGINVTNLSEKSELSRPAVSHHLKILKDCGLVTQKKLGTQIFYKLNMSQNIINLKEVIKTIEGIIDKISTTSEEQA